MKFNLSKIRFLDKYTLEAAKNSFSSIIVKVTGIFLSFIISVTLGRSLGPEGLGVINLSNRIVMVLIIVCLFGIKQILIKEVAIGNNRNDRERINNSIYTSYWITGIISVFLSFVLISISSFLSEKIFNDPSLTFPLSLLLITLPFQVFSHLFSSILIGYNRIWQSHLTDKSLGIAITGIAILLFWCFSKEITIKKAVLAYAIGYIFVMFSIAIYWRKLVYIRKQTSFIGKKILNKSFPLYMTSLTNVIIDNADVILLGMFADAKDVGLYTVASRLAQLPMVISQITNSSISSNIATLYDSGKLNDLQKMIHRVTFGLIIVGSIPLFLFVFFGKPILSIWGDDFSKAFWILVILGIGQFFKIGVGAAGQLLVMCGYQKIQGYISLTFTAMYIILNYILIINFGAIGAAVSTSITVIGINLSKVVFAKLKTGILTIPFTKK